MRLLLLGAISVAIGEAQQAAIPSATLTLAQAKEYALRNNPRIKSADFTTGATASVVKEARAAYFPTVSAVATGVDAEHSTILAAGNIQTSSLYTRFASGIAVSQLVTDFGRTSSLTKSADLRRQAQSSRGQAVREQVILQIAQAYFQALGGEAARTAAQAAVTNREATLRQIRALAENSMRSTLDVRFAEVALSQAQLDLYQADNLASEAQADLSAAMGLDHAETFTLTDEQSPAALTADPASLIHDAQMKRPELVSLTLTRDAARRYAQAEGRLKLPAVSLLGVAGAIPAGDPRLPDKYSAAGVNINIPILNGGLFSARHAEAEQRAAAAENDVQALSVQIAREVRVAWLEANTAARRMDVTTRLAAEANEALRLAQTRYDAGLGSIVELSQAQFNQTSAEIQNATARYDYLSRRVALDYATGELQ
jgi:outer membrane protein